MARLSARRPQESTQIDSSGKTGVRLLPDFSENRPSETLHLDLGKTTRTGKARFSPKSHNANRILQKPGENFLRPIQSAFGCYVSPKPMPGLSSEKFA